MGRPDRQGEGAVLGGVKYNFASVCKPITAVAVLKLLNKIHGTNLDSPIYPFLPAHWVVHKSRKAVTFRQALQHKTGFTEEHATYSALKDYMTEPLEGPTNVFEYCNTNYSIFRLIIPRLAGMPDPVAATIPHLAIPGAGGLSDVEATHANLLAESYVAYVQREVFAPIGIADVDCRSSGAHPGLCYASVGTTAPGHHFGDATIRSGASGWQLSASQVAHFFRFLHNTDVLLPFWLSKAMIDEKLGYDMVSTSVDDVRYFTKGGYLPKENEGYLKSRILGYTNGIQMVLVVNSKGPEVPDQFGLVKLREAFDAWYS